MRRNTKANRALRTMQNIIAAGITDEHALISAASDVLGGAEDDKLIAEMVWRKHFQIMEPN